MWEQKADGFQPTCSSRFTENTSRSEFSDHLLVVPHTKCHKEWFKNTLCWFHHLQKKKLRLELEETFAQSRSRVKMRKRRERDVPLWCTSHTKLWHLAKWRNDFALPFQNGPRHIYFCHRNDELTPTRLGGLPRKMKRAAALLPAWPSHSSLNSFRALVSHAHWLWTSTGAAGGLWLSWKLQICLRFFFFMTFSEKKKEKKKKEKNHMGNMCPGLAHFMPGLHNTHFLMSKYCIPLHMGEVSGCWC